MRQRTAAGGAGRAARSRVRLQERPTVSVLAAAFRRGSVVRQWLGVWKWGAPARVVWRECIAYEQLGWSLQLVTVG